MTVIDYTPPQAVRAACRRGLELAPQYGGDGLTDGAKGRARGMAAGNAITAETAKRIKAFHARHTYEKQADPPSPGYVASMLWGGAPGKAWAEKLVRQVEAVSKADKPLGAAFSRARARSQTGSKASQRRIANRYLRQRGHQPIGKAVLDRWRALTVAERTDSGLLEAQGFDREQARALAMAGTGRTRKAVAKRDYTGAYLSRAKDALPADQHAALHVRARGSAGGIAARRARRASQDPATAKKMARVAELRKELAGLLDEVDKSGPTISELSPGGISGGPRRPPRRAKRDRASDEVIDAAFGRPAQRVAKRMTPTAEDELIDAAFEPVAKGHVAPSPTSAPYEDPRDNARFLDAQRLVLGMDFELQTEADDVNEARRRASAVLRQNMGGYDKAMPGGADVRHIGGLNLDLGSGSARAFGFLGLDTYPYDHGTVIQDLRLGIPFPDGSARLVRMCNSLDDITEGGDATELLQAVQYVLAIGGLLQYTGPSLDGRVDWRRLPGLEVVERETAQDGDPPVENLTIQRIAPKLAVVHGADPDQLGVAEDDPGALRRRMEANMGGSPSAALAMANLVRKRQPVYVEQPCRVVKKDDWQQLVYGVVLTPDELDSQDDVMSAEEIEQTAHDFLIDARVVGQEHEDPLEGASVVESYIAPIDIPFEGGPFGPQKVLKGSWVLGVKIQDKGAWQKVLDGDFTGFSVGGFGERAEA